MIQDINSVDGVRSVHDLHVWSITQNMRTLSAHVVTGDMTIGEGAAIQTKVNEVLFHKYNVNHATLQLECADCTPNSLYCAMQEFSHQHEKA